MKNEYAENRNERRSFSCPNKLWWELQRICDERIAVSTYVKLAILEKLIRAFPEKKEYFEELL